MIWSNENKQRFLADLRELASGVLDPDYYCELQEGSNFLYVIAKIQASVTGIQVTEFCEKSRPLLTVRYPFTVPHGDTWSVSIRDPGGSRIASMMPDPPG